MTQDASFHDGREAPLNLAAEDTEDLKVLSALAQDAIFPASEMSWGAKKRRFAILLNRFRWEDAGQGRHAPERVQSVLMIEDVTRVASQGVDPKDRDTILSILSISFEPEEDGTGQLLLTLAGDGVIRLSVETLNASLRDVTRPYRAPSGHTPHHDA